MTKMTRINELKMIVVEALKMEVHEIMMARLLEVSVVAIAIEIFNNWWYSWAQGNDYYYYATHNIDHGHCLRIEA